MERSLLGRDERKGWWTEGCGKRMVSCGLLEKTVTLEIAG